MSKKLEAARKLLDNAEGWYWPLTTRKAHAYDEDRMSLCNTRMEFRFVGKVEPITAKAGPDDCAACRRKVDAAIAIIEAEVTP